MRTADRQRRKKRALGGDGSTPGTLFVAKAYRLNEIFRENGN